jgi:RNA polymerase sigma factor (sigma-70 family)
VDACKRAERALCVYGEIKRTKTAGGEQTAAFVARVTAALGELSTDELLTVQCLYIQQLTQEETAEATECDPSTVSRRKRRAVERMALLMYPDQYIMEKGLH